jgi:hypothetical protein
MDGARRFERPTSTTAQAYIHQHSPPQVCKCRTRDCKIGGALTRDCKERGRRAHSHARSRTTCWLRACKNTCIAECAWHRALRRQDNLSPRAVTSPQATTSKARMFCRYGARKPPAKWRPARTKYRNKRREQPTQPHALDKFSTMSTRACV